MLSRAISSERLALGRKSVNVIRTGRVGKEHPRPSSLFAHYFHNPLYQQYLHSLRGSNQSPVTSITNVKTDDSVADEKNPVNRHSEKGAYLQFLRLRANSDKGPHSAAPSGQLSVTTERQNGSGHSIHKENDQAFHEFLRNRNNSDVGQAPSDIAKARSTNEPKHNHRHSINKEHDHDFYEFMRGLIYSEGDMSTWRLRPDRRTYRMITNIPQFRPRLGTPRWLTVHDMSSRLFVKQHPPENETARRLIGS
ncbi:hypothetical protein BV898_05220 [Hypsibius exemplaris]|uniref:Uncharacterized protein n=1 Tax=Hypsibius exemplaris TaxID=2072580 RepID=A0A1W0X0D1_HYPEX|nr:hypothetical protein BV898_05220 [Hypsibius exemplaris]